MTLLRMSTGEDWNRLMYDIAAGHCQDTEQWTDACGNEPLAYAFFVAFQIIGAFTILNVFVAVIIENLNTLDSTEGHALQPDTWINTWLVYDPQCTGMLHFTMLEDLLVSLGRPLGFSTIARRRFRIQLLLSLTVEVYEGMIVFPDLFAELAGRRLGRDRMRTEMSLDSLPNQSVRVKRLKRRVKGILKHAHGKRERHKARKEAVWIGWCNGPFNQNLAAYLIQVVVREWLRLKKLHEEDEAHFAEMEEQHWKKVQELETRALEQAVGGRKAVAHLRHSAHDDEEHSNTPVSTPRCGRPS